MRLNHITISSVLACVVLQPVLAAPQGKSEEANILSRISLSFSALPLNSQAKNLIINFADTIYAHCETPWNCRFEDVDHVDHGFEGEQGYLSSKSLNTSHYQDKSISALGIGFARDKSEVLNKISSFLNTRQYECSDVPDILAGGGLRYSGNTACVWTLVNGHVSASFSEQGQLASVRFSHTHPQ
jgi:hypothetical protein